MAKHFVITSDQRIDGTLTAALDSGDWYMEGWIKPASAGENSSGKVLFLAAGTTEVHQWGVGAGGGSTIPVFARQKFSTTDATTTTSTLLTASNWYFVVVTYTDADKKLRAYYGSPTVAMAEMAYGTQTAGVGTRTTGGTTFCIGDRPSDHLRGFDGDIVHLRCGTRLPTLTQMENRRAGALPIQDGTLTAYWPLDSDLDANAVDLSGKRQDGTVTGATAVRGPSVAWKLLAGGAEGYAA